jgi:hypothetical protein
MAVFTKKEYLNSLKILLGLDEADVQDLSKCKVSTLERIYEYHQVNALAYQELSKSMQFSLSMRK